MHSLDTKQKCLDFESSFGRYTNMLLGSLMPIIAIVDTFVECKGTPINYYFWY